MFVLHHGWRSSASRRVRLCLAEKGLKFESVLVDLTKMEHHSPAYLKLNPNGVIPLLILPDGRSLYESGTICEYLDETYPEPPLSPDDAYGRAEMRNWIRCRRAHRQSHHLQLEALDRQGRVEMDRCRARRGDEEDSEQGAPAGLAAGR